jgi:hypothetical protein
MAKRIAVNASFSPKSRSAKTSYWSSLFMSRSLFGVLVWKFVQAEHVITNEPKLYAELQKLDAQEQNELRRLIRCGKMSVGPPIVERIAAKTELIYREVSGVWRILLTTVASTVKKAFFL